MKTENQTHQENPACHAGMSCHEGCPCAGYHGECHCQMLDETQCACRSLCHSKKD